MGLCVGAVNLQPSGSHTHTHGLWKQVQSIASLLEMAEGKKGENLPNFACLQEEVLGGKPQGGICILLTWGLLGSSILMLCLASPCP